MTAAVRTVPWLILAACAGLGSYQFIHSDGSSSIEEGAAGLEAAAQALPRAERVLSQNLGDAKRAIESELGRAERLLVERLSAGEISVAETTSATATAPEPGQGIQQAQDSQNPAQERAGYHGVSGGAESLSHRDTEG